MLIELAVTAAALAALCWYYLRGRRARQIAFIETYVFHPALKEKVGQRYPHLDSAQLDLVFRALRDYFACCNRAGRRTVAMPSQVVDVAWHEFILFTRAYLAFSKRAIGRFLHHTPATAMGSATLAQDGIRRTWRLACARERIDPGSPSRLPRLFAIDGLLEIEDGFRYALNCRDRNSPRYGEGYCAGHIGCSSGCAGDSGADSGGGFFDGWFDGNGGCGSCGGD